MSLATVVVSDWPSLVQYRDAWQRFETRCPDMVPFFRWVWLERWWASFADAGDRLHVILVVDGAAIFAALPTYIRSAPAAGTTMRVLRFLGTGEAEYEEVKSEFGSIFVAEDAPAQVLPSIVDALHDSRAQWDVAEFNDVLESGALVRALTMGIEAHGLQSSCTTTATRYCLGLAERTADSLFGRRVLRKLRQANRYLDDNARGWTFVPVTAADVEEALSALVRLHQDSWTARGRDGAFVSARFERFHRHIVGDWRDSGDVRLYAIRAGERILGVLYLLAFGGRAYFYQSGLARSSEAHFRPGYVLHAGAIEALRDEGFECYDFMAGGEASYKGEFVAAGDRVQTRRVYHAGLRSRWLYANARVRERVRAWRGRSASMRRWHGDYREATA